jgi:hypothetical protein
MFLIIILFKKTNAPLTAQLPQRYPRTPFFPIAHNFPSTGKINLLSALALVKLEKQRRICVE